MKKDTITLTKYLVAKEVSAPLKIQKLLFFLRLEELKSQNSIFRKFIIFKKLVISYFEKENNFQAWIWGPVNVKSYQALQTEGFLTSAENFPPQKFLKR